MKILAIDTATEACSVALMIDNKIDDIFEICPQQHSQKVLPMIDTLLKRHDIKLKELDVIAFGRGPGSFTGVRIATGIVQGLALGADLPVVEVSTLAAMAQQNYEEHGFTRTHALIDARMAEVYMGDFEVVNGVVVALQDEAVLSPTEALKKYATTSTSKGVTIGKVGTGWDAYPDELKQKEKEHEVGSIKVLYPSAKFMLSIAMQSLESGDIKSADDLSPTYLRDKVTWKKLPGKE